MGGRHRSGGAGTSSHRGKVVGSAGIVVLCGALVYGVGVLRHDPVVPDPPRRTATASPSASQLPAGSPTLAVPAEVTPGAGMKRPPVARTTQARPTVPATRHAEPTSAARRTKQHTRQARPRVRRSGRCYVVVKDGVRYVFCPRRHRD